MKESPKDSVRDYLQAKSLQRSAHREANSQIAPYMLFQYVLGDQKYAIRKVFDILNDSEVAKKRIIDKLDAMDKNSVVGVFQEIKLERGSVANEEVQAAFAGTLFVLLNSILQNMVKLSAIN